MSHILMLCHDQNLDRRIIAQALSLIAIGHRVTLLALAYGPKTESSITTEGIQLIRIGLNLIIPANDTYNFYIRNQKYFNKLLNNLCNAIPMSALIWNLMFRTMHWLNWIIYRILLSARYHNRSINDPLPFTSAFTDVGIRYPADLVQVHDLPTLQAGVTLSTLWQVPLVYDAHELYPEQRSFSKIQRKLCSKTEARLIQKAVLVFAVNDSIAKEMATRYGIAQPITLLNALDPPKNFNPNASYNFFREKFSLSPKDRILLFQGGFAPYRNLERLIKAMVLIQSSNIHLVMMGFGDFGEKLRTQAKRLGLLGKKIHFLAAVPQSDLLQYSASADIGIIPYPHVDLNSYYCTPNKLFEFIQAGLPMLANDSPELKRFVADHGFGIVESLHTSKKIAMAIDKVFASDARFLWKQNLAHNRHLFNWKRQGGIYLNALCPLLGETAYEAELKEATPL